MLIQKISNTGFNHNCHWPEENKSFNTVTKPNRVQQVHWMMNTTVVTLCSCWSPVTSHLQYTTTVWIIYWVVHQYACICQSEWPHSLWHGSVANHLLGLLVQIPLGTWMPVSSEYCVLSGKGLCDELITYPEESYLVWCVWVSLWSPKMRKSCPTRGYHAMGGGGEVCIYTSTLPSFFKLWCTIKHNEWF